MSNQNITLMLLFFIKITTQVYLSLPSDRWWHWKNTAETLSALADLTLEPFPEGKRILGLDKSAGIETASSVSLKQRVQS